MFKKKVKTEGMIQLTTPNFPDTVVKSQYGTVNYRRWLELEAARLRSLGRIAKIKQETDGRISLHVSPPPEGFINSF